MKIYLLPMLVLLLAGCDNAGKLGAAIKEIEDRCVGKMGVEVTTSTYSNSVSFKCDDLRKSEKPK